ncbi:spike glycoprotein [Bulbul coronavirus HKU11-796]|uniref:Spike glycoprotein n=1 Tax=Bulbul coronavirus HKU11-796 TaxID=572287 RepID=B6VDW9_9NIDO|nr:spike glycoprotein [Bulbul coronavirus HKU11-796]
MQRVVLISLLIHLAAASVADRILDFLTFPNGHKYLYPHRGDLGQLKSRINSNYLRDTRLTSLKQGYLTEDFHIFSPLSNSTIPISGLLRSYQPLYLACYVQITNTTLSMFLEPSTTETAGCSGTKDKTHDALRLILDLNEEARASINITTTKNILYVFVCSDSQDFAMAHSSPLLKSRNAQLYCFINNTYLGPLPANLTDFTIYHTGQLYANGYYLGVLPDTVKQVRLIQSSIPSNYTFFALANLTDTLITLSNTTITNVTYCDRSTLDMLACQISKHYVDDGFYSDPQTTSLALPRTIVTLPKVAELEMVNLTIDARYSAGEASATININGNDTFCVTKPYFHINAKYTCSDCVLNLRTDTCSFDINAINNGMSFSQFCLSTKSGSCSITLLATKYWNYQIAQKLYVTAIEGQTSTGTTATSAQAIDSSNIVTDVCTDYTIYGVSGTGIITHSDLELHNGIAFTSPTGELFAFKNTTSGRSFQVTPCDSPAQLVVVSNTIVGAITSNNISSTGKFTRTIAASTFYYSTNATNLTCTEPVLSYGPVSVCSDGAIAETSLLQDSRPSIVSLYDGEVEVPSAFTLSVQTEYLQVQSEQVVVDCARYVCNGNARCTRLLSQYTSACSNIESALHSSAQLDSREITNMFQTSSQSLTLANISNFQSDYNFTNIITSKAGGRSAIEDLLFNKVVTNGLGTVDQDYKACSKDLAIADLVCTQYYNGIMVLPGVVDAQKMAMYTASLTGAMVFGGMTAAAAIPFSTAVQARLNYVALQTNVLQENQKILAESFNSAVGNISLALSAVNDAIKQTSESLLTVATAINKIQTVVNSQGEALSHLTAQLSNNFQAISTSIQDIYNRLDEVQADQQVDRLITGRLAALNAYVTQLLNQMSQIRQSRLLAQQKINECVKSQSSRYGFCGNGTHLFSLTQSAPNGIFFMHAVLVPQQFTRVNASAGICVGGTKGYSLQPQLILYQYNNSWRVTPRNMYEPRVPRAADFIPLVDCSVTYYNATAEDLPNIIPDYVDVNQTVSDIINSLPTPQTPTWSLDQYNYTILNLSQEIKDLQLKSQNLTDIAEIMETYIQNLNKTIVDLQWLNKVETYLKWPWYIWLAIFLAIAAFACIIVTIFLCTGCCGGCFGCCGGCFGLFSKKRYPDEPTPVSFKLKEW